MPKKAVTPKKVVAPKKVAKKTASKKTTPEAHDCSCCSAVCGSRK
ncbi:MAG: hypothetical protein WCJ57_00380 [Candidatus Falkowbacteria bacterium]